MPNTKQSMKIFSHFVHVVLCFSFFIWLVVQCKPVENSTIENLSDATDANNVSESDDVNTRQPVQSNLPPRRNITRERGLVFRYPWTVEMFSTPLAVSPTTSMLTTRTTTSVTSTTTLPTTTSSTLAASQRASPSVTTTVTTAGFTSSTTGNSTSTTVTPQTTQTSTSSSTSTIASSTPIPQAASCDIFNGSAWLNNQQLNGTAKSRSAVNGTSLTSWAFYGIKYGTGQRFQPSVKNTDHSYYNAPGRPLAGYLCPQAGTPRPMSEDCLYLNIFVPSSTKLIGAANCSSTPVVMFVHGGAYRTGGKDFYPSTDLSNALQSIVVIPNFRLGIFGFFSTQDKSATGNWGLYDLKLVLQWISNNIQSFGGDPAQITLIGHSTGAALVSILMLDPENRNLLHGAVAMSGSALAPWAISRRARATSALLSRLLKCPDSLANATVTCLKTKSVNELLDNEPQKNDALQLLTFGPVIDGLLIPDEPAKMMSAGSWNYSGSFVNGFLSQDAAILLAADQIWNDFTSAGKSFEPDMTWLPQLTFPESVHAVLGCRSPPTFVMKQIYSFYELAKSRSWTETRKKLIDIATDLLFVVPAAKEAGLYLSGKLAASGNTLYSISYSDKALYQRLPATPGTLLGASHGLDLAYLFGPPVANLILSSVPITFDTMSAYERVLIKGALSRDRSFLNNANSFTSGNSTYLSLESISGWVPRQQSFSKLIQFWDGIRSYAC